MGLVIRIGSTTLAAGIITDSVVMEDSLSVNGSRLVQIEELIRAAQISIFDRVTIRNEVRFRVLTMRASVATAISAALQRRQTLEGSGTLTIELVVDGVTHTWTAARAAWRATESKQMGPTTEIAYSVTCGSFAYSSDDADDWADDDEDGGDFTTSPSEDEDGGHLSDNLATADIDGGTFT